MAWCLAGGLSEGRSGHEEKKGWEFHGSSIWRAKDEAVNGQKVNGVKAGRFLTTP
jgi:hypothetical protein